jgi:L-ascorbate metabolism protein UlaG (beta-lactamase superfamily)
LALTLGLGALFAGVVAFESWVPVGQPPRGEDLTRISHSSRHQAGRFTNFLPANEPEFWSTLVRWFAGAENTVPNAPLATATPGAADFQEAPTSGLRLTWFGHSTVLVEIDGERLLLDPVWSERCSPLRFAGPKRFHPPPLAIEQLPKLSGVVISHDHYDHLDYGSVLALNALGVHFYVPLGVGSHLRYWGVDAQRVTELDWWQEARIGKLTLTATPARHFSGRSLLMSDRDQTLWAGWAMSGPDHRVFYSGDTAMFPEFEEIGERLGPFDATLIEVGAYNQLWADVHLGPEQALTAHRMVRGKVLLPVHWGTFDLALHTWTEPMERILAGAKAQGIQVVTPRPGQSIEPLSAPLPERWWPDLPYQTAEESPVISSGLKRKVLGAEVP